MRPNPGDEVLVIGGAHRRQAGHVFGLRCRVVSVDHSGHVVSCMVESPAGFRALLFADELEILATADAVADPRLSAAMADVAHWERLARATPGDRQVAGMLETARQRVQGLRSEGQS